MESPNEPRPIEHPMPDLENHICLPSPTMEELTAIAIADLIECSKPGSSLPGQTSLNPEIPKALLRALEML